MSYRLNHYDLYLGDLLSRNACIPSFNSPPNHLHRLLSLFRQPCLGTLWLSIDRFSVQILTPHPMGIMNPHLMIDEVLKITMARQIQSKTPSPYSEIHEIRSEMIPPHQER